MADANMDSKSVRPRAFLLGVGTSSLWGVARSVPAELAPWFASSAALRDHLRAAVGALTPDQLLRARELSGPVGLLERLAVERILAASSGRGRGAEVDTLAALEPPPRPGDKVILFLSYSMEAVLAGRALWRALQEIWQLEVVPYIIPDFDLDRPEVVETRGVYNLFKEATVHLEAKTADPLVIATAGFKALSSYLTLAGLLHGAEIVYLYEDAQRVLRLPRVRLRPDVRVFCEHLPVFLLSGLADKAVVPWSVVKSDVESSPELEPYLWTPGPMVSLAPLGVALIEHAKDIYRDPLTGAWRRSLFDDAFLDWFRKAQPAAGGIFFLDIDHFKTFNDTHGHAAGDDALREFARRLTEAGKRGSGRAQVFRWGGEEFVVVAPFESRDTVLALAEGMRARVAEAPFAGGVAVTASIGVATWPEDGGVNDFARLLGVADKRLYAAKNGGRNRVVGSDG